MYQGTGDSTFGFVGVSPFTFGWGNAATGAITDHKALSLDSSTVINTSISSSSQYSSMEFLANGEIIIQVFVTSSSPYKELIVCYNTVS